MSFKTSSINIDSWVKNREAFIESALKEFSSTEDYKNAPKELKKTILSSFRDNVKKQFERENFVKFSSFIDENSTSSEVDLAMAMDGRMVAMIVSNPGMGKTATISDWAERSGYSLYVIIGSRMEATDISGLPVKDFYEVSDEKRMTVTNLASPKWQAEILAKKKCIIFLDEYSNSKPDVRASMLNLMQDRQFPNGEKLPEETVIVCATNPPSCSPDGYELDAPTANRIMFIKWELGLNRWANGMKSNWGKFEPNPYVSVWREIIAEFVKSGTGGKASLLNNFEEFGKVSNAVEASNDESLIFVNSNAFASPRSWDNLAKMMGEVEMLYRSGFAYTSNSVEESIKSALMRNCAGIVGEASVPALLSYYEEYVQKNGDGSTGKFWQFRKALQGDSGSNHELIKTLESVSERHIENIRKGLTENTIDYGEGFFDGVESYSKDGKTLLRVSENAPLDELSGSFGATLVNAVDFYYHFFVERGEPGLLGGTYIPLLSNATACHMALSKSDSAEVKEKSALLFKMVMEIGSKAKSITTGKN